MSDVERDPWGELADAFYEFIADNQAAMILMRVTFQRSPESAARLIVDQVSLLLARWHDLGDDEATVNAVALWSRLALPECRKALVDAVRERFRKK